MNCHFRLIVAKKLHFDPKRYACCMLAPSNLTVILLAVFVLHVIAFQLGGSKFSFAIPNETNASSLIDESTHSLTAVNIDTSLSGNLTRQLKWIASKEQENYYDFVAVGDWG